MAPHVQQLFARNVRLFRTRTRWSQVALAEAADISPSYLAEIEMGRKFPSATVLQNLADALGVEPSALFSETGVGLHSAHETAPAFNESQMQLLRTSLYRAIDETINGWQQD